MMVDGLSIEPKDDVCKPEDRTVFMWVSTKDSFLKIL